MNGPLLISLTALLVSIASYLRSGRSQNRERLLSFEQRRQQVLISLLESELLIAQTHELMRAFATGDAHLDARIEALNKDTENLLNELREARLMLDGVKVTAAPPERAELSIETALGRAQQIYHRAQGLKQSTERFRENTK